MGFLLVILVGVNLTVNLSSLFWTQPRTIYNYLRSKYSKLAGKQPVRVRLQDKNAPSNEIQVVPVKRAATEKPHRNPLAQIQEESKESDSDIETQRNRRAHTLAPTNNRLVRRSLQSYKPLTRNIFKRSAQEPERLLTRRKTK